jgi:hypothetical protein
VDRGKDGALDTIRRVLTSTAFLVAVVTLTVGSLVAPAAALTPLAQTDVEAFTSRADAWTEARDAHRDIAHEQALELADIARQAEDDQIAAEEAARAAEAEQQAAEADRKADEEIVRTSTTTTTAPPPTTTAPTTTVEAAPPASGDPTPNQWAALRQCESSGNYTVVSANGRYRGAYQFSQATWDGVARMHASSLVGVDPAAANPADQDAMALALWRQSGWSPWPHCGAKAADS